MVSNDWVQGSGEGYHQESALYEADVLAFVKSRNPKNWISSVKSFLSIQIAIFLEALLAQLKKTDEN
ncbi:hypothetical protein EBI01_16280 [Marinomonas rhizomae]|nr:hypothetical protein EBI01_16280 [Marinomonas rhizomae]